MDMVADDFVLALPGMRPRRPPPAQLHRNALSDLDLAIRELRMQIARCGTEIPEYWNSDAFGISETDIATNRESISILPARGKSRCG